MSAYKKVMDQIQASEQFKNKMQKEMMEYEEKEKRGIMKKMRVMVGGLVACAVFAVIVVIGLINLKSDAPTDVAENANPEVQIDMPNKNFQNHSTPSAKEVVNIEGFITKVGEDGMSFTLDNGMVVVVTENTVLGIYGPTAPPIEEQFFEPTFSVGNAISGYTEDPTANPVIAKKIYSNWVFEEPIE